MKRILERMTLGKRLALFGGLGILLVAGPLAMVLVQSLREIAVARTELAGIAPAKQVFKAMQLTQQHRGLAANVLGGNQAMESERAAKQAEVDKALEELASTLAERGAESLAAAAANAAAQWKTLARDVGARALSGEESFARHTALVGSYFELLDLVLDRFGLSYDPAADGYHLIIAVLVHMPQLAEALGQARARGSLYLARKAISAEERAALAALADSAERSLRLMSRELGKAMKINAEVGKSLGSLVDEARSGAEKALALAREKILRAETLAYDPREYFSFYTRVIDGQFGLLGAASGQLERVLESRIRGLLAMNAVVLGALALVVALAIAVGVAVARSILREVGGEPRDAAELARRVAAGDFSKEIALAAGDETSVLAAMRRMQQAVAAVVAAQLEMRRQHEAGALSWRIAPERFEGAFREMAAATNELAASHLATLDRVVQVVSRYAAGDFAHEIERLPGEKARIRDAVQAIRAGLEAMSREIGRLVEAAERGDFSVRGDEAQFSGEYRRMVAGLNAVMRAAESGLSDLVRVLAAFARGDLTERMRGEYQGMFGRLAQDANATAEALSRMVQEIKGAAEAVDVAAREIAAGNADLSSRTEEQASSLEETAASMEELTGTVKSNAENARQANQLAVGASEVATKGGSVVREVVATMRGISDASKKIADIIGVIDGIAFQTNLLALNAAVEAARAGEQGRGFAVVAAEVRGLAQRSAAAAKEIKALIEDSVGRIEAGGRLVDEAGRTMEEIVASVKRVTDIMGEIQAASQEQSAGIEQVNKAVSQMDQTTQQNAALVEEATAAAESLKEQAAKLVQAVANFRIEQAEGAAAAPAVPAAPARERSWDGRTERRSANRPRNVARLPLAKRSAEPPRAGDSQRKAAGAEEGWEEF